MDNFEYDQLVLYKGTEYKVRNPHSNCNCGMISLYNDRYDNKWVCKRAITPNKDYQDRFEHAMKYL